MAKAISYIRFSAINQGKGSTISRQRELVDQWLKHHPDIERSPLSATDKGKSGYSGEHLNHGLGLIRAAINAGQICSGDYILVEAIDRIGRLEPLDMVELITSIVKKGVTIITLEDNHEYTEQTLNHNSSSLYILVGKVQQAHDYSKQLSRRITKAYERKRRQARNGEGASLHTPIWLDKAGELKPVESKMVTECIELYLKGYGARQIIQNLLPTYSHLKGVHPSTLKRWFQNRVIIGEWDTIDGIIPNVFKPLIDELTFYKLQAQIKQRRKHMSPAKTYELSGLAVCAQCKKSYHFQRKKHKDYVIIYANCSTYLKRGKDFCNNRKTWPYEVLMHIYEETHLSSLQVIAEKEYDTSQSDELIVLRSQLEEVDSSYRNILGLIEKAPSPILEDRLATLSEDSIILRAQIENVESKLGDNSNYILTDGFSISDLMDELSLDPIQKRDVLLKSGYRIPIDDSQVTINGGRYGSQKFTLMKRSTKRNCYLVEHAIPEFTAESYDYRGAECTIPARTDKLAIDREGVTAIASGNDSISWEQFIGDFDKYKLD